MINNKTWKNFSEENDELVHAKIIELAGVKVGTKTQFEKWKVKISDSEFTLYSSKNGNTLYCNGSRTGDPIINEIYEFIGGLIDGSFKESTKKYTIGLDEAGKGEVVGHLFLSGVLIPAKILGKIDNIVGVADTKKKKVFKYWDDIFLKIDEQKTNGLDFVVERIEPWIFDKYNVNKIIDVTYQRILNQFLRKVNDFSEVRIVLDDYGIGDSLRRFLKFLEMQGAEIVIAHKADENYLEAKVASLVSKRHREMVMSAINNNPKFKVDGINVGSGNAGNQQTINWLNSWRDSGKPWPWFIKKSFKTIQELEGGPKTKKAMPPFNERIFSKEFLEGFRKGKLSIKSLEIVCPHCGENLKSIKLINYRDEQSGLNISEFKCSLCSKSINNLAFSLKYYCGYMLPDSNAISRSVITNDLSATKNFENYKIILSSIVRSEIDGTPRAKRELEKIKDFCNKGVIKIENVGDIIDISNLASTNRDEIIATHALDHNCILLTGDKSMTTFALGMGLFVIEI